jgi:spore maturation protein CgeB
MNIAFFGSSLVSAYWNGAATYYRGIIRALHALGHGVTFYEPDAYGRQQHRDMEDPEWAKVVVYQVGDLTEPDASELHRALDEASKADMVVKASGVGVFDELLEGEVLEIRRPGMIVAFWDVDAPATLDRLKENPDDPLRSHIPRYDLILTYGGGEPVVSAYTALGARTCHPIYNAADPATHHPVAPDPRFAGHCGFLGHRLPDREGRVEEFFLKPAARLPEKRFILGGNAWEDKAMPSNVDYIGYLSTRDHNAFNSSLQAVLNINRASMAHYGFSPPTRVFEVAAAGGCLITDAWVGIDQFLEPDREVLVAADGDAVAYYLAWLDPAQARAIGLAAHARILAQHTYEHRSKQLQQILDAESMAQKARFPA